MQNILHPIILAWSISILVFEFLSFNLISNSKKILLRQVLITTSFIYTKPSQSLKQIFINFKFIFFE